MSNKIVKMISLLGLTLIFGAQAHSSTWSEIRTSGAGTGGWQPIVCENGDGWRSCEMPVTIALVASPISLPATGEITTITATLTDYYGVGLGAGIVVNWKTTDGSLSAIQTSTDSNGLTSIALRSSPTLGGATVTATTSEEGGQGAIFIPFTDKWIAIASLYTGWSNSGVPYNCTAWSPDTSTVTAGQAFTQNASCIQNQVAYRQDREQSLVTGAIRNTGSPVALYQSISMTISQEAIGTKQTPISIVGPTDVSYGDTTNTISNPPNIFYYNLSLPNGGTSSAFVLSGMIYVQKVSDTQYILKAQRSGINRGVLRITASNAGVSVVKDVNVVINLNYGGGGH